ncbi:MAG: WbqC family protein [Synechococcaceae cyanobacterium ELA445]
MQPHFFPYIGYFFLIFSSDIFVIYDTAQFSHQSWQSRNRIIDQSGIIRMVSVPVDCSTKFLPISEVLLSKGRFTSLEESLKELTNRIESYYYAAPFVSSLKDFLVAAFEDTNSMRLVDLNIRIIQVACTKLGGCIGRFPDIRLFSEVMETVPDVMSQERVKRIAQCASILKCDQYLTPVGSVEYMLSSQCLHELKQVTTTVLTSNRIHYQQIGAKGKPLPGFQENLSILDLIANVGWDGIADILLSRDLFDLKELSSFQSPVL